MAGQINANAIKMVIDILKERRSTWTDLVAATGIPPRTLTTLLSKYLEYWGLAVKDKNGNWAWYDTVRIYATGKDLELALGHSKQLTNAFDMFAAGLSIYPSLNQRDPLGLTAQEFQVLSTSVEAHIRTGYPALCEQINDFKNLVDEGIEFMERSAPSCSFDDGSWKLIREIYCFRHFKGASQGNLVKLARSFTKRLSDQDLANIDEFEEKRTQKHKEVSMELEMLRMRVNNNEPLEGRCSLCPHVAVKSN